MGYHLFKRVGGRGVSGSACRVWPSRPPYLLSMSLSEGLSKQGLHLSASSVGFSLFITSAFFQIRDR